MSDDKIKNLEDLLGTGIKKAKIADSDVMYQDSEQLIKAKHELERSKRRKIRFVKTYTGKDL